LATHAAGSTAVGGPVAIEFSAFDEWSQFAVVYNGDVAVSIQQSTFGLSSSFPRDGEVAVSAVAIRTEGQATSTIVVEHCVFASQSSSGSMVAAGAGVVIRANRFWDAELLACEASMNERSPTLVINEVVASQTRVVTDRRGDFEDYIELFNPHSTEVLLTGFTLVGDNRCDDGDDEPHDSLALHGLTVPGHGFLLIFADDDAYQGLLHGS
jgi:hypothetical protein